LIGVEGIIRAQKNEIEKKKVSWPLFPHLLLKLELRIENEKYFREHSELNTLIRLFMSKVLDDRPENILSYAGQFFDRAELREKVDNAREEQKNAEARLQYMNDLIKGKTLIE